MLLILLFKVVEEGVVIVSGVVILVSVSDLLLNNLILADTRPMVEELGEDILDSLSRHWGESIR